MPFRNDLRSGGPDLLVQKIVLILCVLLLGSTLGARQGEAAVFQVNTTGDGPDTSPGNGSCSTGVVIGLFGFPPRPRYECTLRAALQESNALAGFDTIVFSGVSPDANSTVLIRPASTFPIITDPVMIDGYTATGYDNTNPAAAPVVHLNGSLAFDGFPGLWIGQGANGSVIRGLSIYQFRNDGLRVAPFLAAFGPSGITIQGCYVGARPGLYIGPNQGHGISISNSVFALVGKSCSASGCTGRGNLISGNDLSGIHVNSDGVSVFGNLIGTNAEGSAIQTFDATETGNEYYGVEITAGTGISIGSLVHADAANVISGNRDGGLVDYGTNNGILGNSMGVSADRTDSLPNAFRAISVLGFGALVSQNVVGGHSGSSISASGSGHEIVGNRIGVDAQGGQLGLGSTGISISGIHTNIGGVGAGNVIGFQNWGIGQTTGSDSLTIQGNYIGTDEEGNDLGNNVGIHVFGNSQIGAIGGRTNGLGNVIGFNGIGIRIRNTALGNRVEGNYIGTDPERRALGNLGDGIQLDGGSNLATIGAGHEQLYATSAGNIIAFNEGAGIAVIGDSLFNPMRGNFFWAHDNAPAIDLAGDGPTSNDVGDADAGANGLQNFPVFDVASTGVNESTGDLEIRYRIDSDPTHANYPLDVDFYLRSGPYAEADEYVGWDSYPATSASTMRSISIEPFLGASLEGLLVAIVTDADGNTSEFSPQSVPVPEPAGILLLGSGVLAIGGLRAGAVRRSRENAA